jgi:hypothetical protein
VAREESVTPHRVLSSLSLSIVIIMPALARPHDHHSKGWPPTWSEYKETRESKPSAPSSAPLLLFLIKRKKKKKKEMMRKKPKYIHRDDCYIVL